MHDNSSVKHLLIIGSGLDAWFTAATLASVLNSKTYRISVLGSNTGSDQERIDCTLPDPKPVHPSIRFPEDYLVAKHQASFSYGIAMSNWNSATSTYFHPFSTIGAQLDTVGFQHLALRLRKEGTAVRLGNFTLATLAAQANRLQLPQANDRSVLSTCEWGIHVNTKTLSQLKQQQAEQLGVQKIDAKLNAIHVDTNKTIQNLELTNGENIEADLYFDCSGSEAKLIDGVCNNNFIAWNDYFPNTQKLTLHTQNSQSPSPYSLAQAHTAGWIHSISCQHELQISNYFSHNYMSEEQATIELGKLVPKQSLEGLQKQNLNPGRRKNAWIGNCIAIGQSAIQLEPLGISPLQLLRSSLNKLITLFPKDLNSISAATEYNRRNNLEFDNARDFAFLHYFLNGRTGEAYWDSLQHVSLPEVLNYKLELYKARGQVALYDEEPLQEQSWFNLYDEHQVKVRNLNPLVYGFKSQKIQQHLQRVREIMLSSVKNMPTHAAYLAAIRAQYKNK